MLVNLIAWEINLRLKWAQKNDIRGGNVLQGALKCPFSFCELFFNYHVIKVEASPWKAMAVD